MKVKPETTMTMLTFSIHTYISNGKYA